MNKYIKVGIGVMILDGNKILLGHRSKNKKDTGGIYEVDCWTVPGGKQEYDETVIQAAIREVKEETNLDIYNPKVISAIDDIASYNERSIHVDYDDVIYGMHLKDKEE